MNPSYFLKIEENFRRKMPRIWGIEWWEIVRYDVWHAASSKNLENGNTLKKTKKKIYDSTKNRKKLSILNLKKCEVLVMNHPRREYEKGRLIDKYTSALVNDLSISGLRVGVLQTASTFAHYDMCHFDTNVLLAKKLIKYLLLPLFPILTLRVFITLIYVGKRNEEVNFSVHGITKKIYEFIAQLILGIMIIRITKTRIFIVVPGPGNEGYICAANLMNIKIMEVQHGSPVFGKINYTYAKNMYRAYAPDIFLKSGEKSALETMHGWQNVQFFPLGSPYLTNINLSNIKADHKYDVLIMGQQAVDLNLRDLILPLLESKGDLKFLVRAHPNPYSIEFWKKLGISHCFDVSDPTETDLVEDILKCRKVVGGFSTALYEADFLGKPVAVIKTQFNQFVDFKVSMGCWSYVSSANIIAWAKSEVVKESGSRDEIIRYCPSKFTSFIRSSISQGINQ